MLTRLIEPTVSVRETDPKPIPISCFIPIIDVLLDPSLATFNFFHKFLTSSPAVFEIPIQFLDNDIIISGNTFHNAIFENRRYCFVRLAYFIAHIHISPFAFVGNGIVGKPAFITKAAYVSR